MKKLLLASAFIALAAPALAQTPPQLPAGEGRDIVAVACSQCHPLSAITNMRKGEAGWRAHVYDMFVRGAQVTDSEADVVISYLATNFGPGVNVPKFEAVALPDGVGKDLVQPRCGTACHDLTRVTVARHGRKDWSEVVKHMINIGAPMTADEGKVIGAYLQEKFGAK